MLLFNHGFRVTKHIRVSGLFCVNDGGQGENWGPLEDTWRVPENSSSHLSFRWLEALDRAAHPVHQVRSPCCSPVPSRPSSLRGRGSSWPSRSPPGTSQTRLRLGKGAPSQQDFPLRLCGGACSLRPPGFGCGSSRSARWVVPARVEFLLDAKQLRGFPWGWTSRTASFSVPELKGSGVAGHGACGQAAYWEMVVRSEM